MAVPKVDSVDFKNLAQMALTKVTMVTQSKEFWQFASLFWHCHFFDDIVKCTESWNCHFWINIDSDLLTHLTGVIFLRDQFWKVSLTILILDPWHGESRFDFLVAILNCARSPMTHARRQHKIDDAFLTGAYKLISSGQPVPNVEKSTTN